MSTGSASYPLDDSWVAAVHATEDDLAPLGTALVIDERRLLTSEHVVVSEGTKREPLWVAFPKAVDAADQRRRVTSIVVPDRARVADLAVLVLDEPVPAGVAAAPLVSWATADHLLQVGHRDRLYGGAVWLLQGDG